VQRLRREQILSVKASQSSGPTRVGGKSAFAPRLPASGATRRLHNGNNDTVGHEYDHTWRAASAAARPRFRCDYKTLHRIYTRRIQKDNTGPRFGDDDNNGPRFGDAALLVTPYRGRDPRLDTRRRLGYPARYRCLAGDLALDTHHRCVDAATTTVGALRRVVATLLFPTTPSLPSSMSAATTAYRHVGLTLRATLPAPPPPPLATLDTTTFPMQLSSPPPSTSNLSLYIVDASFDDASLVDALSLSSSPSALRIIVSVDAFLLSGDDGVAYEADLVAAALTPTPTKTPTPPSLSSLSLSTSSSSAVEMPPPPPPLSPLTRRRHNVHFAAAADDDDDAADFSVMSGAVGDDEDSSCDEIDGNHTDADEDASMRMTGSVGDVIAPHTHAPPTVAVPASNSMHIDDEQYDDDDDDDDDNNDVEGDTTNAFAGVAATPSCALVCLTIRAVSDAIPRSWAQTLNARDQSTR
jgi:hypothetical protein